MPDVMSTPAADEHGGIAVSRVERTDSGPAVDDGSEQMNGSEQMIGRSSSLFGDWSRLGPGSAAARVRNRTNPLPPGVAGAGTGTTMGSAPMGGRNPARNLGGDGVINEADRGGAYDY